jgi:hypothetical protein
LTAINNKSITSVISKKFPGPIPQTPVSNERGEGGDGKNRREERGGRVGNGMREGGINRGWEG